MIFNNGTLYISEKMKNDGMSINTGTMYSDKDLYSSNLENTITGVILGTGNIKSEKINNYGMIISEDYLKIDSELFDNCFFFLYN